jgi:NADH-quinone oxidoreductase subunit G
VEALVSHFQPHPGLNLDVDAGILLNGVWVSGGYVTEGFSEYDVERMAEQPFLIVQDLYPSPMMDAANYQLPGAAFAEREGSYVNHAGILQSFQWAIRPPTGVWTEGQLLWRLLGRPGLYNARAVMEEIAAEIPYFAPAAAPVPPTGIALGIATPQLEPQPQR